MRLAKCLGGCLGSSMRCRRLSFMDEFEEDAAFLCRPGFLTQPAQVAQMVPRRSQLADTLGSLPYLLIEQLVHGAAAFLAPVLGTVARVGCRRDSWRATCDGRMNARRSRVFRHRRGSSRPSEPPGVARPRARRSGWLIAGNHRGSAYYKALIALSRSVDEKLSWTQKLATRRLASGVVPELDECFAALG